SRETEMLAAEIIRDNPSLHYLITSEAGASVYSASKLARKEFPDLDVSIRGAVSIGRRVQDPLAELVKIDPKSIGVGLYQHDVNQANLNNALDQVVESVVNAVGVELNTASGALLTHIVGIGPSLAEKIVQYREEKGPFQTREEVKSVPGMGPRSFEQAAGFLRIRDGKNPLDATAIHHESYGIAAKVLDNLKLPANASTTDRIGVVQKYIENTDIKTLAKSINAGVPTLTDILNEIARPGRDPREDLPRPILRVDVLKMDDLTPGMQLKGTIRNVVDFGAFVDIGVKTDGLLHRSRIPRQTQLQVGDIIDVIIQSIDKDRNRISLEMKESIS
ncbi:MAG: helix-hairpin-helix domain-containing protein, partial [Anaerolineaceae bacterium]|nr:helix-hairpin-helix domain-containing protein [Anaerolineaceae bacterium]